MRRIGTHTSGVFPLIIIPCALVILCRYHRNYRVAVREAKKGKLPAVEPFFYINPLTGVSKYAFLHNRTDRIFGLLYGFADQRPFAGGQTVRFYHNRISDASNVVAGLVGVAEVFELRHWNPELPHHYLCVTFAGLQPARPLVRTDDRQPSRIEQIDNTRRKRLLRADKRQVDPLLLSEIGHLLNGSQVHAGGCLCDSRISMRYENPAHPRTLSEFPCNSVISAASTYYQNSHQSAFKCA